MAMLKRSRQSLRECNLQELLTMTCPVNAVFCLFLLEVMYTVYPTFECFTFSLLPTAWRSSACKAICLTIDGGIFFGALIIVQLCLVIEILFFNNLSPFILNHVTPRANLRITIGADLLRRSHKLGELHLLLRIFNESHRWSICQFRLSLTIIAIVMGFFGVHHFDDNMVLTVVHFFTVAFTMIYFAIIYDRTFAIPHKIKRCKKLLMISARRLSRSSDLEAKVVVALAKSIPALGVDVGRFYRMKRTSTPAFVDFVVRFTARLLLAFR